MRIGSFNVENLFARAEVLGLADDAKRGTILAGQAELNQLLELSTYDAATRSRILTLLESLGVLKSDDGPYVRLRVIRDHLLKRPRSGDVQVVANGRADWIGWAELKTKEVDETAMLHTAMVIRDIDADILGVVEADSRPVLRMFTEALLPEVHGRPYPQVMLVDGNDDRGIDVGILAKSAYTLDSIRSHVFDVDGDGVIFSRDCCEYHFVAASGKQLIVLMNHLKSKGYSTAGDPLGAKRRRRQATRIAEIYKSLAAAGQRYIAVVGDFNDDPTSESLSPLIQHTDLRDISTHKNFDFDHRQGTYGSGGAEEKIDYVLLSPALWKTATGGAVFRKGVWRGSRTKDPWTIYESLKRPVQAASDHAAIYAELDFD